jgi:formate-dependent nitrite reductase cytochrome c552 subunit
MKIKIWTVIIFICVSIVIGQAAIRAQSSEPSTLDGVFTSEQAGRGRQIVINIGCADCHNSDLGGGLEETPSLVGNEFIAV